MKVEEILLVEEYARARERAASAETKLEAIDAYIKRENKNGGSYMNVAAIIDILGEEAIDGDAVHINE